MRGIRKEFPGVVANDDVSFDVRRGEVHALLGENGAGKSTLMNILYGLYRPDGGEIRLNGKPVSFASARDAIQAGIGMVHQHFMLIPVMTVAENIVLGIEPHTGLLLDENTAEQRVRELSEQFGFAVDPTALISDITVGQEQRVHTGWLSADDEGLVRYSPHTKSGYRLPRSKLLYNLGCASIARGMRGARQAGLVG